MRKVNVSSASVQINRKKHPSSHPTDSSLYNEMPARFNQLLPFNFVNDSLHKSRDLYDGTSRLANTHIRLWPRGTVGPRQHWVSSRKETIEALEENTSTPQRRLHPSLLPINTSTSTIRLPPHLKGARHACSSIFHWPGFCSAASALCVWCKWVLLVWAKTCKTAWGICKNNRLTATAIVLTKAGGRHALSLARADALAQRGVISLPSSQLISAG